MPELPEVETIVRTLAPQVVGRRIRAVHRYLAKTLEAGADLLPHLVPGACIVGVRRRGKVLLMDLESPDGKPYVMAFHLKMTGRLFVHPADVAPHKHTRMMFELEAGGGALAEHLFFDDARTFGYCRIMRSEDLPEWPFMRKLGPEPLTLEPEAFVAALAGRRGKIKALLLDQSVIAGVGNIYADEACFRSGIRPDAPAYGIPRKKLEALLENLKAVLRESIAECGSSIRDYRDANGDAGAFQNMFRVYGRAGQPCTMCGRPLDKTTVAGRTTVYCPVCQSAGNCKSGDTCRL